MKLDWYTKGVLTIIAVFLGWLVFGGKMPSAHAQPDEVSPSTFDRVELIPDGGGIGRFFMFDKRTGRIYVYSLRAGHFEFQGPGAQIDRPGAEVKRLK